MIIFYTQIINSYKSIFRHTFSKFVSRRTLVSEKIRVHVFFKIKHKNDNNINLMMILKLPCFEILHYSCG